MTFARPDAKPPPVAENTEPDEAAITAEIERARVSAEPMLNFSDEKLSTVPEAAYKIIGLQSLILQNTHIERLPGQISRFVFLKSLTVSTHSSRPDRGLREVDDGVCDLENLENLDLSGNRLTTLLERITALAKLNALTLYQNELRQLPASDWENLRSLKALEVSENHLRALPSGLGQLPVIESLNASANMLTDLPRELGAAKSLTSLSLNRNRFAKFPAAVTELDALEYLDLSGNDLTELPPEISRLTHLKRLKLGNNLFTKFPEGLRALPLQELDISGNRLTVFPAASDLPGTLRELNLSCNNLASVPEWIETSKLRRLMIRGNLLPETKVRAVEEAVERKHSR